MRRTSFISRSMLVAGVVLFAGVTTVSAQTDTRPVLRIGVQQLTTTGKLEAFGEYSNVALRGFYSFLEPLIDYQRQDPKTPRGAWPRRFVETYR